MISFEKSVGAVVFRRSGGEIKYLLLHYRLGGRSSGKNNGHWDFPKGHQEKRETDEETLKREIKEETGIADLKITPLFRQKVRYFYRAKGDEREERINSGRSLNVFKRVVYYAAETEAESVRLSSEHTGFLWLNYAAALDKVTYKNSKRVLKKANDHILKIF